MMDGNNVIKPDTENTNSSRIPSSDEATSRSVQNVDPFAFVDECEVEVSTVYFFSLFNEAITPAELTELQMNGYAFQSRTYRLPIVGISCR